MALGPALGALLAPLFVAGTKLRRARFFHPSGSCWEGVATARCALPLSGPVLVRVGGAAWKSAEWPDVLGFTVRFLGEDEQDLLMGTFRQPWMLPLAFLTTPSRDYNAPTYWAGVPFDVEGVGRAELRLVPRGPSPEGPDRTARLQRAVDAGQAVYTLEASTGGAWIPLCEIALTGRSGVDDRALRFSPFHAGRGLTPRGLLTDIRRVVYPPSQEARS